MIAGQCSGIGKSTITVGLLMALKKMGKDPQPFKSGPDFLDPMHHSMITGRSSRNLDTWMFPEAVHELFIRSAQNAGISVIEGVMGLYDGMDGKVEEGSSAHLSKKLKCPVILVVDASGSARSVGAVVEGFRRYDEDVNLAGVIVNRCGSERHFQMVKESIRDVPVLGGLRNMDNVELKSRHLGLVPAGEQFDQVTYDNILSMIEDNIDLSLLTQIAEDVPELEPIGENSIFGNGEKKVKLGVARDKAFNFYYEDNLDILSSYGAEIIPFSPLDDSMPDVDGLYIGGGFPEMFAEEVAANEQMKKDILSSSLTGMPIYAECGGLMYLSQSLTDPEGNSHPMCGIFDAQVEMTPRLQALGYVQVENQLDTPLGPSGSVMRGHEFHYSRVSRMGEEQLVYGMQRGKGIVNERDGMLCRNTLASYTHLHFGNCPQAARNLVESCLKNQD